MGEFLTAGWQIQKLIRLVDFPDRFKVLVGVKIDLDDNVKPPASGSLYVEKRNPILDL